MDIVAYILSIIKIAYVEAIVISAGFALIAVSCLSYAYRIALQAANPTDDEEEKYYE